MCSRVPGMERAHARNVCNNNVAHAKPLSGRKPHPLVANLSSFNGPGGGLALDIFDWSHAAPLQELHRVDDHIPRSSR